MLSGCVRTDKTQTAMEHSVCRATLGAARVLLTVLFFIICLIPQARAAEYEILTTHLPPWSMEGNTGIFADLITEIEQRLGKRHEPQYLPWSRAQEYVVNASQKNYLIFPVTRTPNREQLYKWVIKVMPVQLVFATMGPAPKTLEEASDYGVIIVQQNAPPEHFLNRHGFSNLSRISVGVGGAPKMLQIGRTDAWFSARDIIKYSIRGTPLQQRINLSEAMSEDWSYIAASRSFPKDLAHDYLTAFQEIKKDGTFKKILEKYLGK